MGWVFALHQQAGRGRYGRHWVSPHGAGVYASCLFGAPPAVVPTLPQLVGVALCEGLRDLGFECRLKWPNDVLLAGQKLGGVLLQTRGSGETVQAVASFGVNHNLAKEDLPRQDSASLVLAGARESPSLVRLSCGLAERVEVELRAQLGRPEGSAAGILARYRDWSAHQLGDLMAVRWGERVCSGEFAGFAATGELRLRDASGEQLLSSGELEA